jgi:hypothetical protein
MRSKQKNFRGFDELITKRNNLIPVIQADLKSNEIIPEKILSVRRFLLLNMEQKSIALYSNGSDKEIIKTSVLETITVFENGFVFHSGYLDSVLWLISMSILCNIDLEDFKRITKVLERDKVQDKLLDFLVKYKQTDWQGGSENFIQKTPYAELRRIIDESDNENGIKQLQDYLKNKWYQGHDKMETAWVDSHKNTKVNTYFGYWAWEVAALVKAKGWDDEKLKYMDYYPYDAVHW